MVVAFGCDIVTTTVWTVAGWQAVTVTGVVMGVTWLVGWPVAGRLEKLPATTCHTTHTLPMAEGRRRRGRKRRLALLPPDPYCTTLPVCTHGINIVHGMLSSSSARKKAKGKDGAGGANLSSSNNYNLKMTLIMIIMIV